MKKNSSNVNKNLHWDLGYLCYQLVDQNHLLDTKAFGIKKTINLNESLGTKVLAYKCSNEYL